jgi:hypothetical protein
LQALILSLRIADSLGQHLAQLSLGPSRFSTSRRRILDRVSNIAQTPFLPKRSLERPVYGGRHAGLHLLYKKLIAESERDPSRDEDRHRMLLTLLSEEEAKDG